MVDALIGRKLGMTQIFVENGNCVPVTVIEAGPCLITKIRTKERDGYQAIQLGFEDVKKKKLNKPRRKYFEKSGISPKKTLKEFRCKEVEDAKVGQFVKADIFKEGDFINVTGTTKGRGFAGVMKRHGFHGAPASHGAHESFRGGGSIGMCVHPGKVFKGKKMPGHYGNVKCTTLNVEVISVHKEKNHILLKGATPGPNGGLLFFEKSRRKR